MTFESWWQQNKSRPTLHLDNEEVARMIWDAGFKAAKEQAEEIANSYAVRRHSARYICQAIREMKP